MHDVVETVVFIALFLGIVFLFLGRRVRVRVRLVSCGVLLGCLMYYLFQLKVL